MLHGLGRNAAVDPCRTVPPLVRCVESALVRDSRMPRAGEGDPAGVAGCVQEVPDAAAAGHLDLPLLAGLSAVGSVRQSALEPVLPGVSIVGLGLIRMVTRAR